MATRPNDEPFVVVLTGPYGIMLGRLVKEIARVDASFCPVVNVTTRAPEPGEEPDKDYSFVSTDVFADLIDRDELLEWARVFTAYYGIPKSQVRSALTSGQNALIYADTQGAKTIKELIPDSVVVFVTTETLSGLFGRIARLPLQDNIGLRYAQEVAKQDIQKQDDFDLKVYLADSEFGLEDETDRVLATIRQEATRVHRKKIAESPSMVFLCHAKEDRETVLRLFQNLVGAGFQPWIDEISILPGQDWDFEIKRAIRRSRFFLACLSQKTINKKGYVQKEIRMALDELDKQPEGAIYLIPVRLEECEIPIRLSSRQYVDLFRPGGYKRLLITFQSIQTDF